MSQKRLRYADVYNEAYESRHSFTMSFYIRRSIRKFRRSPFHYINIPGYIRTMLATQSIAERYTGSEEDRLQWAFDVVAFIRQRAARIITQRALEYIYHPKGPWIRSRLEIHASSPMSTMQLV